MWGACLHIAVYLIAVKDGAVAWNDAFWLLKFVLASWHLLNIRRLRNIVRYWELARFGVMKDIRCDPNCIWTRWCIEAVDAFRWDGNADVWEALHSTTFEANDNHHPTADLLLQT